MKLRAITALIAGQHCGRSGDLSPWVRPPLTADTEVWARAVSIWTRTARCAEVVDAGDDRRIRACFTQRQAAPSYRRKGPFLIELVMA